MKKIMALLIVALLAVGGWYALSPPMTLNALRDAAEAHDADSVLAHVDLPALRASLKEQARQRLEEDAANSTGLEALGMQLGMSFADPLIDAMLTEDTITRMIEQRTLTGSALAASAGAAVAARSMGVEAETRGDQGSIFSASNRTEAAALPADAQQAEVDFEINRRGFDEFRVYPEDRPDQGELIFTRHGLRWKLSGMTLPEGSLFGR